MHIWCLRLDFSRTGLGMKCSDLVGVFFREPEPLIRSRRDAPRVTSVRWDWELREDSGGCDPTDLVGTRLREPHVTVGPSCDPKRITVVGRDGELGEDSG